MQDAYDLPAAMIDLTPLTGVLQSGSSHVITIRVLDMGNSTSTTTRTNWFVSGNMMVWRGDGPETGLREISVIDSGTKSDVTADIQHGWIRVRAQRSVTISNGLFAAQSGYEFINEQDFAQGGKRQRVRHTGHQCMESAVNGTKAYAHTDTSYLDMDSRADFFRLDVDEYGFMLDAAASERYEVQESAMQQNGELHHHLVTELQGASTYSRPDNDTLVAYGWTKQWLETCDERPDGTSVPYERRAYAVNGSLVYDTERSRQILEYHPTSELEMSSTDVRVMMQRALGRQLRL